MGIRPSSTPVEPWRQSAEGACILVTLHRDVIPRKVRNRIVEFTNVMKVNVVTGSCHLIVIVEDNKRDTVNHTLLRIMSMEEVLTTSTMFFTDPDQAIT